MRRLRRASVRIIESLNIASKLESQARTNLSRSEYWLNRDGTRQRHRVRMATHWLNTVIRDTRKWERKGDITPEDGAVIVAFSQNLSAQLP